MKKLLTTATMLLSAMMASRAEAAINFANPYVELGVGDVFDSDASVDNSTQTVSSSPNAFLAAGFSNVLGPIELRLDYATTDRDYDLGFFANQKSTSVMVDAIYDAPIGDRFSLYGGAGAGMVKVEFSGAPLFVSGVAGSDTVFGWEAVGGARVRLMGGLSGFVEGRYQTANDASIDGHTFGYSSTALMGGLRWTFGSR